jgi:HAD-hyrolase-like
VKSVGQSPRTAPDAPVRLPLIAHAPCDILAAKANRIRSISVATGTSTPGELADHEPDVLTDNLQQLTWEMLIPLTRESGIY